MDVVDRIYAAYLEEFRGEGGQTQDLIDIALSREETTFTDVRAGILKTLKDNYDSYTKTPEAFKASKLGVQDVIKLRKELNVKPELFKKPEAFKGEPVDDLFEFVSTNGDRHPELKDYYKALRIRVPDGKGGFRVLSGTEAIYDRAVTLKLQDPKTLLMDPYAKVLQDSRKENDMKTFPSEQKALRNMRTDEQQNFNKYFTMLSEKRGGQEANQFTFVRNGNTSPRQNLNNLSGEQVVAYAKNGSDNFGMYNMSTDMILDLDRLGLIDKTKPFNEDAQSFAVVNLMAIKANRKSNAIRGAITDDTKNFGKLTNFTQEEQQVLNQVFPNLNQNYFAQFQNLEGEVAKIIISDLEKEITAREGRKGQENARLQLLRNKGDKKALRSGRVTPPEKQKTPTTMEELLELPSVKKARSKN